MSTRDSETSTEGSAGSSSSPSAFPSLEVYIAEIQAEAASFADSIGEDDKPFTLPNGQTIVNRRADRLKRAERYARWRYAGFLSGECASF